MKGIQYPHILYISCLSSQDDAAPAGLIRTHQCLYGSCKADTNLARLKRILQGNK